MRLSRRVVVLPLLCGLLVYVVAGLPWAVMMRTAGLSVGDGLHTMDSSWTEAPWVAGACAVAVVLWLLRLWQRKTGHRISWVSDCLVAAATYLVATAVGFAIALQDLAVATEFVPLRTVMDGSMWVALLAPILVRVPEEIRQKSASRHAAG